MRILVAYATKHGSTQQVGQAIADALRVHDAEVEFGPARGVRGIIGDQDLVVLGAPIYSGRWHRNAHTGSSNVTATSCSRCPSPCSGWDRGSPAKMHGSAHGAS